MKIQPLLLAELDLGRWALYRRNPIGWSLWLDGLRAIRMSGGTR